MARPGRRGGDATLAAELCRRLPGRKARRRTAKLMASAAAPSSGHTERCASVAASSLVELDELGAASSLDELDELNNFGLLSGFAKFPDFSIHNQIHNPVSRVACNISVDRCSARSLDALHDPDGAESFEALRDLHGVENLKAPHDLDGAEKREALHDLDCAENLEALHDLNGAENPEALHGLGEALHDLSGAESLEALHDMRGAQNGTENLVALQAAASLADSIIGRCQLIKAASDKAASDSLKTAADQDATELGDAERANNPALAGQLSRSRRRARRKQSTPIVYDTNWMVLHRRCDDPKGGTFLSNSPNATLTQVDAHAEEIVERLAEQGGWCRIRCRAGLGWLHAQHIHEC